MSESLQFTGERFLPECAGEIVYEHWHRYVFARRLATGRRVLDLACGEGYGAAMLSATAQSVIGVDLAEEAIRHARDRYGKFGNCHFVQGSCAAIPAANGAFDLIVSFETIEHVDASTQRMMLAEFQRVLAPGGLVILSSPNRALYTDLPGYHNEFHVCELYRDELAALLAQPFPHQLWFSQKIQSFSALWGETQEGGSFDAFELAGEAPVPYAGPEGIYYLVVMARARKDLPAELPRLSLFLDRGETLLAASHAAQKELMQRSEEQGLLRQRLESMIAERDLLLEARNAHIKHLESLKGTCDQVIVERDAQLERAHADVDKLHSLHQACAAVVAERDSQLASVNAHVIHLEGLVEQRERLIAERDGQLAELVEALREERRAHEALLIELKDSLKLRADLQSTLEGMAMERSKLVRDVAEQVRRLGETEKAVGELRGLLAESDNIVRYRQSFRWWLRLPLFRLKMALKRT